MKKMVIYFVFSLIIVASAILITHQTVGFEKVWASLTKDDVDAWSGFETLQKTEKKNQYLVCPEQACKSEPDRISPQFPANADQLTTLFTKIMLNDGGAELVAYDEASKTHIFKTYSPTIRFPDLTFFQAIDLENGQSTILIYAKAQLGELDFGANKKRIDRMIELLSGNF